MGFLVRMWRYPKAWCVASVRQRPAASRIRRRLARQDPLEQLDSTLLPIRDVTVLGRMPSLVLVS